MGKISSWTYDAGITGANNNTTTYQYNGLKRLTTTVFLNSAQESYAYYADGLLLTKTDRKNQVITYTYDNHKRLIRKTYPNTVYVQYTYVGQKLTQVFDNLGCAGRGAHVLVRRPVPCGEQHAGQPRGADVYVRWSGPNGDPLAQIRSDDHVCVLSGWQSASRTDAQSIAVDGETTLRVNGRVIDGAGRPISGVVVYLVDAGSDTPEYAYFIGTTDGTGAVSRQLRYRWSRQYSKWTYRLAVLHYNAIEPLIFVTKQPFVPRSIKLRPIDTNSEQGIVVFSAVLDERADAR